MTHPFSLGELNDGPILSLGDLYADLCGWLCGCVGGRVGFRSLGGRASHGAKSPKAPPAATGEEEERPQLSVPGFWALSLPPVQKEVWLTEEQQQQLRAISAKYQAKVQAAMEGLQRLPPEEQKRRLDALRGQARKDMEAVRKQVADVLTPQQLESYEKIAFRLRVPVALEDSRLLGSLDLTDWQKKKLGQIRDNLEERLHRVQIEAADKTLDILTPAQQEKLKKQFSQQEW